MGSPVFRCARNVSDFAEQAVKEGLVVFRHFLSDVYAVIHNSVDGDIAFGVARIGREGNVVRVELADSNIAAAFLYFINQST